MTRPKLRTEYAPAVLEMLRDRPSTKSDLLDALHIPPATLTRLLGDLRQEGYGILAYRDGRQWLYRLEHEPREGDEP